MTSLEAAESQLNITVKFTQMKTFQNGNPYFRFMWLSENVDKGSEVVGVILGALMEVDMELDGAEVLVDIEIEMEGKQIRRCENVGRGLKGV